MFYQSNLIAHNIEEYLHEHEKKAPAAFYYLRQRSLTANRR